MKKKDIILISIIVVLIAIIIALLIYYNKKEDIQQKQGVIEAEILAIGSDYLLVTTEDDIDYAVFTKDLDYKVGDTLKLELKDINDNKLPIEATAKNITLIEEIINNSNEVKDDQDEKVVPPTEEIPKETDNKNTLENTTTNNETTNNKTEDITTKEEYTEADVISYFSDLDEELITYNENNGEETLSKTIKTKFVKCIDFIFYNGEIGGKTFNELTNTTKLKVISIALSIDEKIDSKFPNYKDSISSKYQNIKTKLVEKYLDITTTICTNDPELCKNAKEGFKDLKNSFGLTWDVIKELASKGTSKLKDWYEIWRYN